VPYDLYRATRRFGSLDGLRCVAILMVVWHHTGGDSINPRFLHLGGHGVTVFFVISGFLISTMLIRERARTGTVSARSFYVSRSLRIFPLYFTVLAAYTLLVLVAESGTAEGSDFWHNLPFFATFTSNWLPVADDGRMIFYFAWSLALQEQFYLLWPSVERYVPRRWLVAMALGLLALTLAANLGWVIAPAILLGVLLAHALDHPATFRAVATVLGRKPAAPLLLGALLIALGGLDGAGSWGQLIVMLLIVALVGSCVVREDHGLAPVLRQRTVAWIGLVSFGVYLLHMLALNVARAVLGHLGITSVPASFVLATTIAVCAASLSYKYYESRFLKLRERFTRRRLVHSA
jgi:peptidoglycan/LPS O-acetylase OafA/YrhL